MGQIVTLKEAHGLSTADEIRHLSKDERDQLAADMRRFTFDRSLFLIGPRDPVPVRPGENRLKTPLMFVLAKDRARLLGAANRYNWHDIDALGEWRLRTEDDGRLLMQQLSLELEWRGFPLKKNAKDESLWHDLDVETAADCVVSAARKEGIDIYTTDQAEALVHEMVRKEARAKLRGRK